MGRKKSVREVVTRFLLKLSKRKRLALTPRPKYHGASLADIDRYLFENFRSVYESESSSPKSTPQCTDLPSDGCTSMGSLVKEARMSMGSISPKLEDAMPLVTESVDPYFDFKQSMKEMIEAQHMDGFGSLDWEFLGQMLVYFLELNDKEVHAVIFRAFMDVTQDLMVDDE